jgi:hypothetical protein
MSHMRRALIALLTVASFASLSAVAGAASTPVWLCRPGASPDPCVTNLSAERFSAAGQSLGIDHLKVDPKARFDCFYVYPTVSAEPGPVSDKSIAAQPELDSIVLNQAAEYSQDCNVYAPVYRQITIAALNGAATGPVTAADAADAYADVSNAFAYYLKHYNRDRGFVLMGHSQGSFMLRQLITKVVDPSAKLRKQLISAVQPGGNVVVGTGPTGTGGDFKNVAVCHSNTQVGCVVGWSTFDQPVPADTMFGKLGTASPTQPGTGAKPATKILCSNPAALGGGSGLLTGLFSTKPFAPGLLASAIGLLGDTLPTTSQPFVETVDGYRAQCSTANGADVLQVTAQGTNPVIKPSPTPEWGLHLVDVGLGWDTMVKVVASEGKAWLAAQPAPKTHHKAR